MRVKIFILDGLISGVLGDQETMDANVDVEIVDYDRNTGDRELLDGEWDEAGLMDIPYSISHCIRDKEEFHQMEGERQE